MNLSKVDLNLFIVFDAIYTEANLTRAGQIVGITQPAVSNALARLRETFNDPLFVRTAQGMVPTPMAQNIIGPVRNALSLLRVSVQESRIFNPQQAAKTYRISMTDLTEAVILPLLFQRLRRLAPTVVIEFLVQTPRNHQGTGRRAPGLCRGRTAQHRPASAPRQTDGRSLCMRHAQGPSDGGKGQVHAG